MDTKVYLKLIVFLVAALPTNGYVQTQLDAFDYIPANEHVASENKKHVRVRRADVSKIRHLYDESRVRPYTEAEKKAIVDKHNEYRSNTNPEASNMEYMVWNEELAYTAGLWASVCFWGHGKTNVTTNYTSTGQNLWLGGGQPNGVGAVRAWHDNEYFNYRYDEARCIDGQVCGHYTQVLWAKSSKVGCARAYCATTINSQGQPASRTSVWIFACHYVKPGNYAGVRPFLSGPSCSQCPTGSGLCLENSCATPEICSDRTCDCRQTCYNCATLTDDCYCRCKDGWTGVQCSEICEDKDDRCGRSPGWPSADFCGEHEAIPKKCPVMCGVCTPADDPTAACTNTTTPPITSLHAETISPVDSSEATTPQVSTPQPTSARTLEEDVSYTMEDSTTPYYDFQNSTTIDEIVTDTTTDITTKYDRPCDGKVCNNGGLLDTGSCKCACTREYAGQNCKKSKQQLVNGVELLLSANIDQYTSIELPLRTSVAKFLTNFCNRNKKNTQRCCSGNIPKRSNAEKAIFYNFTTNAHVITAMGYPEKESEDDFRTMLLVRIPSRSNLCDGSSSISKRSIGRTQKRMKRSEDETTEVFLDQDVLLSVISDNMEEISSDIDVPIDEVRRGDDGTVESAASTGLHPGGTAGIVIFVLLVVIIAAVVIVFYITKRNANTFTKSSGSSGNTNKSSEEVKEQNLELNPTKNGTEHQYEKPGV